MSLFRIRPLLFLALLLFCGSAYADVGGRVAVNVTPLSRLAIQLMGSDNDVLTRRPRHHFAFDLGPMEWRSARYQPIGEPFEQINFLAGSGTYSYSFLPSWYVGCSTSGHMDHSKYVVKGTRTPLPAWEKEEPAKELPAPHTAFRVYLLEKYFIGYQLLKDRWQAHAELFSRGLAQEFGTQLQGQFRIAQWGAWQLFANAKGEGSFRLPYKEQRALGFGTEPATQMVQIYAGWKGLLSAGVKVSWRNINITGRYQLDYRQSETVKLLSPLPDDLGPSKSPELPLYSKVSVETEDTDTQVVDYKIHNVAAATPSYIDHSFVGGVEVSLRSLVFGFKVGILKSGCLSPYRSFLSTNKWKEAGSLSIGYHF